MYKRQLLDGSDITNAKEFKRNEKIGRVYQNPSLGTCPSTVSYTHLAGGYEFSDSGNSSGHH